VENDISRTAFGEQHQASLTTAWPHLQSTAYDSPTDVGSTSSNSDAATQFSNATTKFSNAALSVASTLAQHAVAASPEVPAASSPKSSAHVEHLSPRKPRYQ
jgi:hypothetical protein